MRNQSRHHRSDRHHAPRASARVRNVSRDRDGAIWADNAREVAAKSNVIITMLPDSPDVEAVALGPNGLIEGVKSGTIYADMSSIAPSTAVKVAKALGEKGVRCVDAPVSGGEPRAVDGTLAFMVGGSQPDFERILPYFRMMGASALLVGPCGSGCIAKLANQIIVNLNITAVAEAFVFASKAGVDPDKVYQAIRGGLAGSAVMLVSVVCVMLSACATFQAGTSELVQAAWDGDSSKVEALLQAGADVNASNRQGMTPLMASAWGGTGRGDAGIAKALIARGADVNAAKPISFSLLVGSPGMNA